MKKVGMYIAISRATTKNIIQRSMAKKPKEKLKSNSESIVQIIQKWGEQAKRNKNKKQKTVNKMVNLTMSLIMLNINELKIPIKRQGLSEWIIKQHQTICRL